MSQKSWRIETCSGSVTVGHCWRQHPEALQSRPQALIASCLLGLAFPFSGLCSILVLHRSYPFPSSTYSLSTDTSPEQALGQVLWQQHKWWCRSPELAGNQISSEQTTKGAKKKSYFPSNSLHGEAQNQESLSQKGPQSFRSAFLLGGNSPSDFLELSYLGFACTLQVTSWSSQTHE